MTLRNREPSSSPIERTSALPLGSTTLGRASTWTPSSTTWSCAGFRLAVPFSFTGTPPEVEQWGSFRKSAMTPRYRAVGSLGARIGGLMQRMAVTWNRAPRGPVVARDLQRGFVEARAGVDLGERLFDEAAA